jgi:transcriptional regulator with XRE-family HTH domain
MAKKEKTTNAVEILHRRYIKDDAERKASVQAERVNAEVARLVYDLRRGAGLTQKELAELIDTTQSVVSRLEDADYDGHSLSMLHRVAEALKQKLTVEMTAMDPDVAASRRAFLLFLRMLRRREGLSVDELAKRAGIDRTELLAIEWNNGYRPTPLTLHKLGEFYGLPQRRLAALAGAVHDDAVSEHASRFAAQSESFAKLTREERRVVDEFVKFLKAES